MNSRDKWEQLEDSKRLKAIAQNGNNGEHYEEESGQLEFNFWEEQEYPTELIDMKVKFDPETMTLGKMDIYVFNRNKVFTLEDICDIIQGLNVQIVNYGSGFTPEAQRLIDKGLFELKED
jgi:hypothetical protein